MLTSLIPKLISGDIPGQLNVYILYLLNLAATVMTYWLFAYKNSLLQAYQRSDIASKITIVTTSLQYATQLIVLYYRKLPVIAVTATRPIAWLGQNRDQLIDRTVIPKDIAVKSVHLPVIENEQDEWECNLKINDAL